MKSVKSFYIRNYNSDSDLIDDVKEYVDIAKDAWSHFMIEMDFRNCSLYSVHVIFQLKK